MDISPLVYYGSIFVLAIFVGYYVVWSVTPALHTPLMSVTNAISAVIIVGAIIAMGTESSGTAGTISKVVSFSIALAFNVTKNKKEIKIFFIIINYNKLKFIVIPQIVSI